MNEIPTHYAMKMVSKHVRYKNIENTDSKKAVQVKIETSGGK